ncbi:caspase family protein [Leptothoe sp. ISB3NOV94-8A]
MARYALVIGISEYKSKHLANLSKPAEDAASIATILQKYGQCDKEPTVLKGNVTTQQLGKALRTFLTQQAANSEAIIYFTGHGISVVDTLGNTEGCLTTSDCDVTVDSDGQVTDQKKAISFDSLNKLIQAANLSNLVMLIDACHSGDFIERTLVKQSFSTFGAKQDHYLITACRGFEAALAKKNDDHSLFTGAILKALVPENADVNGKISSDRLFDEVRQTLKGGRQEPVRFGTGRSLSIVQFPPDMLPDRVPSSKPQPAVRQSNLPRMPLQMPPLPDHFVERSEHQKEVKQQLLCEETKVGTLVVSAIYGLGGIGKSVLASKLAHDEEIQCRFSDGILWATLGQNPDILPLLSGWIQALGDHDYKPTAIESASNHLRTLLYDKHILLVVDDVWNPAHLDPFRVGGGGCCVLVTTREARISDAQRYDLDVMSANQALELMTQKLSGTLSDAHRQQAFAFAERVGYLPLALELAASQIEEGVTWSELLEDLQDEVARLETLDIYGQAEIPDDAKRKKYSLLACFNLSLKQLSPEQLKQFAWLGVVPEDVNLTQEMAETLWQVTSRQARAILRTFRSKALVLQGAQLADDKPSYRMHDLMHDLAQRLLRSSQEPERDGELPGLGLTKSEAHGKLLEQYREKAENGEWYTLKDDGYIYAHLTWHMEQAEQTEEIHTLLQVSNKEGRNGWYEACDEIGKPAGFVNDLGRAWQLAVEAYKKSPGNSVTLLYRYALIRGSLNSLASNVPAEMVRGLVKHGFWQAAQGLAYAQQAQDPWHRAACISAIVPYMPKALLPEVLKTVGQINDAAYRSYALSKLAEQFSSVWPAVLATIQQIQDRYGSHRDQTEGFSYKGLALSRIVAQLPSIYFSEVIDITHQISDPSDRVMVWTELAQRQVIPWSTVLETTRQIKAEYHCSRALIEMAQHLPEGFWPEALEITRQIKAEYQRSNALSAMAQHLPELCPEALEITRQIKAESSRSRALIEMAQHLPDVFWSEALEITRQIKAESSRSRALIEMAQHLPDVFWSEALEITRQIKAESSRSRALIEMAQHLPDLWPEALEITRQIENEYLCSSALIEMAQHLPDLWPEALEITRQIENEYLCSSALIEMAQHLPDLWPEALEITRQIKDESSRSRTLIEMAQYLPELWPEALEITRQIKDESSRSRTLSAMAQYLPDVFWSEALAITRQIKDESSRSRALSAIAQYLPELWPEALEITRQVKNEYQRSNALIEMAQHLPDVFWSEALEITRQIKAESSRSNALIEMAQHLPDVFWSEALEITRQIKDESSRSRALSAMAQHLPELWPEALEITRQIKAESSCSSTLRAMAQHLPDVFWSEALEITQQIKDESSRSRALIEMAQHLPELWPEALEITQQIKDEYLCSSALSAMAQHLPDVFWPEALEITRQIKDESSCSRALRGMAQHLPENLWPKALEIVWTIKDKYYCSIALQAFLPNLEQLSIPFTDWVNVLNILAYQNREDLFDALPKSKPTIIRLGNEQAFFDILQAIRDVCQQWP